ncbi:MAG: short-chain dehydrogenase [Ancylobacter novellus]|uniref:Short-chain dehydrogenase n=1 Tax=Ancylobacter novellus TaxID=921 RepID=A0A2W5KKV6_ANCNO|nr:MAG: short-chain dehydrogenase [Ancylobacter novellus]
MRRDGARVLVTGAGSGIGRAIAVEADARGMSLVLCGRRQAALAQTAAALTHRPVVVAADISTSAGRDAVTSAVAIAWGALDVLVNNAGVIAGGPAETLDDATLERTLRTNVMAPMALARDLKPMLMAGERSRVVNVGSILGDIAFANFAAYSASKFALRGFSDALRREWRADGIGVTYAAPRATRTDAALAVAELSGQADDRHDPPALVARRIVDAFERGHDNVYARGPERLFVLIQRLFPAAIDRALARRPAPAALNS